MSLKAYIELSDQIERALNSNMSEEDKKKIKKQHVNLNLNTQISANNQNYNEHLFTLKFHEFNLHFYHHETMIVITDDKEVPVGIYVEDNKLKTFGSFRGLKLATIRLYMLEKILKELPFRLKMWRYYDHNQNVYCFNGL